MKVWDSGFGALAFRLWGFSQLKYPDFPRPLIKNHLKFSKNPYHDFKTGLGTPLKNVIVGWYMYTYPKKYSLEAPIGLPRTGQSDFLNQGFQACTPRIVPWVWGSSYGTTSAHIRAISGKPSKGTTLGVQPTNH